MTRATARKAALDRVLLEILGVEKTDPLYLCFEQNGLKSVHDILSLSDEDISKLTFKDDLDDEKGVPVHARNCLKIFKAWNIHLITTLNTRIVDWMDTTNVTEDEYDDFRVASYDPDAFSRASLGGGFPHTPVRTSLPPRVTSNPAAEFRRGIKKSKTDYVVISDEKQWNKWKTLTMSTALTHGCENVVDPMYIPVTHEDTLLFTEQQNFMYDVFLKIIQTPMGKHF